MGNKPSSDKSRTSKANAMKMNQKEPEILKKEYSQKPAIPQGFPIKNQIPKVGIEKLRVNHQCSESISEQRNHFEHSISNLYRTESIKQKINSSESLKNTQVSNEELADNLISIPLSSAHLNSGCSRDLFKLPANRLDLENLKIPLIPVTSASNDIKIKEFPSTSSLKSGFNDPKSNGFYSIPFHSSNSVFLNEKIDISIPNPKLGNSKINEPSILLNSEPFKFSSLNQKPKKLNYLIETVPSLVDSNSQNSVSENFKIQTLNPFIKKTSNIVESKSNIPTTSPSALKNINANIETSRPSIQMIQNSLNSTTNEPHPILLDLTYRKANLPTSFNCSANALNLPDTKSSIQLSEQSIPKIQPDKNLNTSSYESSNPSNNKSLKFENVESANPNPPKILTPRPQKDTLEHPPSKSSIPPNAINLPEPTSLHSTKTNPNLVHKIKKSASSTKIISSPYQIKKIYRSKIEFFNIFKHLIELEEKEEEKEAKMFYNEEFRFYFFNKQQFTILIDYLFLLQDFQSLKMLRKMLNKLKIEDDQRRIAVCNDYNYKIGPKNIKNIAVSDENGVNLKVSVSIVLNFYLFIFDEDISEDVESLNIGLIVTESFERIKKAMIQYLGHKVDPVINSIFLGQKTEENLDFNIEIEDYSAKGLFKLNDSQTRAVQNALNYKVSIIQGPPGTGKTQTISSIVYHIDKLCRKNGDEYIYSYYDNYSSDNRGYTRFNKYFEVSSKILICAASNSPVFDLRRKLTEKGMKVLQVLAKSREDEYKEDCGTLKYHLDRELQKDLIYKKFMSLKKQNSNDPLVRNLEKKFDLIKHKLQVSIIKNYDIICCTTRILQNKIFKKISFDFAIVDEATQCIEPDIVLCLLKNVKHLVLVGDIHQLGPVIKSQTAKDLGFDVTTIERLQDLGVPLTFLDTQYRMQPFLSKFSSINFYDGQLKDGNLNPSPLIFPKTVKTHGFFYHIHSKEEKSLASSSIFNTGEAEAVIKVIKYLRSRNIENKNIGIITFYGGQREYLRGQIMKNRFEDLEVMSVDESQGREKEYIILSCVRSNDHKSVGFLDEYRRLNVAMTRVKNGLVVCGNANTFVKSELWSQLVSYFQANNTIFTGNLNNLKLYRVQLRVAGIYAIKRKIKYSNQEEHMHNQNINYDDFGE